MNIEHVGSTAVPGMVAKPVIDIDLIVEDPTQEEKYVPALERLGYDLTVREPNFYQHRCLRLAKPRVNLHVFGLDFPEHIRHIWFRDWLREHPEDCERYIAAKNC
ncbi:GrpB family protein [Xenorhabdus budapestensis]|uniref:GrpB family protein n=1 Tax=Xenorhabdus budapestensis TaxID=290110 RepID=UPI003A8893C5